MKKVLIMIVAVCVLVVCGVIGNFIATENRYYDEVAMAEEAAATLNEMSKIGAYKRASVETDWDNATYAVTVYMYTADGVLLSSTVYEDVNDFIEAEF